jgi:hypothetical protein
MCYFFYAHLEPLLLLTLLSTVFNLFMYAAAVVIPNAIAITTQRKNYIFRSFWDREVCFDTLTALLKKHKDRDSSHHRDSAVRDASIVGSPMDESVIRTTRGYSVVSSIDSGAATPTATGKAPLTKNGSVNEIEIDSGINLFVLCLI